MMVDSGLYISLARPVTPVTAILDSLLEFGWVFDDEGQLRFLPFGDDGMFDWQSVPLTQRAAVAAELERKASAGELIGVTLLWTDTDVGGNFLLDHDGTITFSPLINRRKSQCFTDASWYLARILPPLKQMRGVHVADWKWVEIY